MAPPTIKSVSVPHPISCGKRIDITVEVRIYNRDTNLTVCFKLQQPTSCRFASLSDGKKKMEECRRRTKLPIGTHKLAFRVKFTCPHGDAYRVGTNITASNDRGERDTKKELWKVDCVAPGVTDTYV